MGWFLSRLFKNGLVKWFHNFLLLTEIVDKTALPNSVLNFNSSFSVISVNCIYQIKNTNVFEHLSSNFLNYLWKSSHPELILQSVFLKLLVMFWIQLRRMYNYWKTLLIESFLVTFLVYWLEFMYRSVLICSLTLWESILR